MSSFPILAPTVESPLNAIVPLLAMLGIIPYLIFVIVEMFNGVLPTEWLVCTTILIVPAVYALLRIKIVNINLYKVVALGLIVNLVYFTSFNLNTFYSTNIEHNNIGDGIAISGKEFINENHLSNPGYVSGDWKFAYYLTVFMPTHPQYIRNWTTAYINGNTLLIFPGCNLNMIFKSYGYPVIKKECKNVTLTDKHTLQTKPFSYYYASKNN
jgi:hypothetical protein